MPLPLQPRRVPVMQSLHLLDAEDAVDAVAAGVGHVLVGRRGKDRRRTGSVACVGYYLQKKELNIGYFR